MPEICYYLFENMLLNCSIFEKCGLKPFFVQQHPLPLTSVKFLAAN